MESKQIKTQKYQTCLENIGILGSIFVSYFYLRDLFSKFYFIIPVNYFIFEKHVLTLNNNFHNQFLILGPKSRLQNRLLFHLSHKFGDEKRLMGHHQSLQDIIEDQLSLASIHYLRSHYQEAIDIYKRILLDNR